MKDQVLRIGRGLRKHSPTILTVGGICGVFVTGYLTRRAADREFTLDEKLQELKYSIENIDRDASLTKDEEKQIRNAKIKAYIPPAISAVLTAGCIFALNKIHLNRESTLIGSLALAYSYRDKVKEVLGIDKEDEIFREFQKDRAVEHIFKDGKELEDRTDELEWYYEPVSKQYFRSNEDLIDKAALNINRKFHSDWEIRFNDFLEDLGCDKSHEIGDAIGWFMTDDIGFWDWNWSYTKGGNPWIDISTDTIEEQNGKRVHILSYNLNPDYNYEEVIEEPEDF